MPQKETLEAEISLAESALTGIIAGGQMGEHIRAFRWIDTSLGPISQWPQSLLTSVNIMLQSPVPLVMLWGPDGIMLYNDAYSVFAGGRHPFLLGSKVVEGWPEVADFNRNVMEMVFVAGKTLSYKDQRLTLYRNNLPEEVWMDLNYSPIPDETGKPGGVLAIVVETTRQVIAEQNLKESEARFRSMAEGSEILISIANDKFESIYFNKAWSDLTGRPMRDLLNLGWADLVHPSDLPQFLETYRQALENQESFNGEFRILNNAGEYRWLLADVPARYRPDGSFAGFISTCVDITERKQNEEERRKLAAIIEGSTDFIELATTDGAIQYLNPAAMRILGWDTIEGKQIMDCIWPDDRPYAETDLLPKLLTEGSFSAEARFLNAKTHQPIWMRWNGMTVKDPQSGKVIAYASISQEITERKRQEAEKLFQSRLISMIAYAQSLFFSNQNIYDMFEEPLQQLLELTESEYGFIGEVLQTDEGKPYLKCCYITNISWDEETRQLWESYRKTGFEFHRLDNLFGTVITTGNVVISNDTAHDPRRSKEGRPPGHPPLNAFLGVPFYKNGTLIGMVGIANKPDGYDSKLVEKLQPFMDACANIITAYRTRLKTEQLATHLAISEGRFRAAVDAVQGILWTNNAKGEMEGEQQGWSALTGQSLEEYQGYGWINAVYPVDREPTIAAWRQAVQEGKTFLFEHRVCRHDGVWRRFSVRAIPIFETSGVIREWVGVHTDVTEQREAVNALKESEERFRTMADSSSVFIFVTDTEPKNIYVNKTWLQYTGLNYEHSLGLGWRSVVHPEDVDEYFEIFLNGFRHQKTIHTEVRIRKADGEYGWMLISAAPRYALNGDFIGYVGSGVDITDRKTAELALRESQERFKVIANDAPVFIFLVGADARVEFWNKTYLEFTGFSYEEAIGRSWEGVIHPDDFPLSLQIYREAYQTRQQYTDECRFKNKNGEYRWILWKGVPRYLPNGEFVGFMGTGVDIHDRKMVEAELASYASRLERSNKELQQFATIASHDLQEPLRKITVFGQMLEPLVSDQGKDYLSRMTGAAERMQQLISDLLLLSKVNRKGKEFYDVDLNQAVKTVLDDLQIAIQEAGATVDLKPLGVVHGDDGQIRQLLQNLIGNALKYRREKEPHIRIYGKPLQNGNFYQVTVEDNGIGIDSGYFMRIFEPFQRLHGIGRYSGTGMGLAICKKIVERHNGTISVESTPNNGSRFSFTLPVR